ncbi:tyrosine-protein phosphatase non-receptor type 18 [Polypterus senegalus]|uniref:tyrosine-protein phosphatase non-receptor type 18 n=1 Tax=Polypterus senegalus TaxID=55291 RepID=UPI00196237AE|nr:tyrosine-protein phosphatase non-receptor type 18 [Polypterus senegalus]
MKRILEDFVQLTRTVGQAERDLEGRIDSEFSTIRSQTLALKNNKDLTAEIGGIKGNVKKNRYKDILPYDQTRVSLSLLSDKGCSDYINANFIKGAINGKYYIATQGPLNHTVEDFWRMVWQYKVKIIMMACKEIELGKKKCEQYWANYRETSTFGLFAVKNEDESIISDEVVVRTLSVQFQGGILTVLHFQYKAWPDHGIPDSPDGILNMIEKIHDRQGSDLTPIIVHCSAGCGRTGVICTVDYIYDLLKAKQINDTFSILDIVWEMRQQRPSIVQTKEQYGFVYHTVAQLFQNALDSGILVCDNFSERLSPLYDNTETLTTQTPPKPATRKKSLDICRKPIKSSVEQRSSAPFTNNMNETYAVVNKNKLRQPLDNVTSATSALVPSSSSHHYDNEDKMNKNSSPNIEALYSAVKPKNKPHSGSNASKPSSPSDQLYPVFHKGENERISNLTSPSPQNHEQAGTDLSRRVVRQNVYDNPLNLQSSEGVDISGKKKLGNPKTMNDEDYEYVSDPFQSMAGQFADKGMGFNCRIRKPKGPRDPPSEWNTIER